MERLRANGFLIGSTTGYTDKMIEIVVPEAKKLGYYPDTWFSPDSTGHKGRPYPYMAFRNIEALGLKSVKEAVKIGDTVSDIKEGKNAGMLSFGVVVGSSEMGLAEEEYESLSEESKIKACAAVSEKFMASGADGVFKSLDDFADYLTGQG